MLFAVILGDLIIGNSTYSTKSNPDEKEEEPDNYEGVGILGLNDVSNNRSF